MDEMLLLVAGMDLLSNNRLAKVSFKHGISKTGVG